MVDDTTSSQRRGSESGCAGGGGVVKQKGKQYHALQATVYRDPDRCPLAQEHLPAGGSLPGTEPPNSVTRESRQVPCMSQVQPCGEESPPRNSKMPGESGHTGNHAPHTRRIEGSSFAELEHDPEAGQAVLGMRGASSTKVPELGTCEGLALKALDQSWSNSLLTVGSGWRVERANPRL